MASAMIGAAPIDGPRRSANWFRGTRSCRKRLGLQPHMRSLGHSPEESLPSLLPTAFAMKCLARRDRGPVHHLGERGESQSSSRVGSW